MNKKVFLGTTWSGFARAEQGPEGGWSTTKPLEDVSVHCLAVDRLQPGLVYAGTQDRGVLRSADYGQTWDVAGLAGQPVKALATSPHKAGTVFAGTRPAALHMSSDGGDSWTEFEAFQQIPGRWWWRSPASAPFTAYIQSIGVSPGDPDRLVAGIEAGAVVHSRDGGQTWSGHSNGAIRDCHNLTFHSSHGEYVYQAGASLTGAAISRNGGETWEQPRKGIDRHYGWACAADPGDPEVWYVSASAFIAWQRPGPPAAHVDGYANAYIYRSEKGQPWRKLNGGLPQPLNYMANALVTNPDCPGHIYTGLSNGQVWFSEDYGDHWKQLPFDLGPHLVTLVLV